MPTHAHRLSHVEFCDLCFVENGEFICLLFALLLSDTQTVVEIGSYTLAMDFNGCKLVI